MPIGQPTSEIEAEALENRAGTAGAQPAKAIRAFCRIQTRQ